MTDLRRQARGRDCMVRLTCCNRNPETVILAHFRMAGISGMGIKPPNLVGAWCCSSCHAWIDTHHDNATQLDFAKGVFRTQAALIKEGIIK